MNEELIMKFEDYDVFADARLTKVKKTEYSLIDYLFYDLGDDLSSDYAYVYCCSLNDIKKHVNELLTRYNVPNGDILLKAFDKNFNDWDAFYQCVDDLFNVWYKSFH